MEKYEDKTALVKKEEQTITKEENDFLAYKRSETIMRLIYLFGALVWLVIFCYAKQSPNILSFFAIPCFIGFVALFIESFFQ